MWQRTDNRRMRKSSHRIPTRHAGEWVYLGMGVGMCVHGMYVPNTVMANSYRYYYLKDRQSERLARFWNTPKGHEFAVAMKTF